MSSVATQIFFRQLIAKTGNFSDITWLGKPIWQNVLDLWTIQETLYEAKPALLIESGSHRGGSAFFYAQLFEIMGRGTVVSIDVEEMERPQHALLTFLLGDSTSVEIAERVRRRAAEANGPVFVILDSDHSESHVFRELEIYAPLVTPGSYCLVQDGVIDTLSTFRRARPGPLRAIERFIAEHREFELDYERSQRFLITHHPKGWLRKCEPDQVTIED